MYSSEPKEGDKKEWDTAGVGQDEEREEIEAEKFLEQLKITNAHGNPITELEENELRDVLMGR